MTALAEHLTAIGLPAAPPSRRSGPLYRASPDEILRVLFQAGGRPGGRPGRADASPGCGCEPLFQIRNEAAMSYLVRAAVRGGRWTAGSGRAVLGRGPQPGAMPALPRRGPVAARTRPGRSFMMPERKLMDVMLDLADMVPGEVTGFGIILVFALTAAAVLGVRYETAVITGDIIAFVLLTVIYLGSFLNNRDGS